LIFGLAISLFRYNKRGVKIIRKGRKNAYDTIIKPNFDRIRTLLENGATEAQVAEDIGVTVSTWFKYKAANAEFADWVKGSRKKIVQELRGALIKRGLGFREKEIRTTRQKIVIKGDNEEDVPAELIKTEVIDKYYPPDVAAINLALKNYDKDNWSNDWHHDRMKEEELEIKKKLAEQNIW
jgi:hypothetical protein